MDELNAALGCSQKERIEEILDKRAKIAGMYGKKLAEVEEVQVPYIAPVNVKHFSHPFGKYISPLVW